MMIYFCFLWRERNCWLWQGNKMFVLWEIEKLRHAVCKGESQLLMRFPFETPSTLLNLQDPAPAAIPTSRSCVAPLFLRGRQNWNNLEKKIECLCNLLFSTSAVVHVSPFILTTQVLKHSRDWLLLSLICIYQGLIYRVVYGPGEALRRASRGMKTHDKPRLYKR